MEGNNEAGDNLTELTEFKIGQRFENVLKVKEFVKKYNEEHFTNLVVQSNNKRAMLLVCKHSVHRDSKSKGKREILSYNYLGCPVKIRMYKSQKGDEIGVVKVTAVDLSHNHSTSKEIFEAENVNFTEDEKELIGTLKAANAKPSQIKRVLLERSKKNVTIQSLKNLVRKISPVETDESSREVFEKFLENTEIEGGEVEWIDDKDGKMKALFITSRKMKSAFRSSNPTLIQLDTSFEFDRSRYKVAAFCYLDTNSDKTEIAAFAMMSEESTKCFDFILQQFSKICIRQDLMFIIDKDFTEQGSIRKVFPSSVVLLCVFHVLKYMRVLFSTIPDIIEVKEVVMDQFKKVLYSHSEDIFVAENLKFEKLVENVQVRTSNGKYVNLKDYYQRNWLSCKLMWIKCYRKGLPLLGDNTTNRIENKFGKLKESIADTFITLPTTSSAIIHLVNYADRMLEERYISRTNKSMKIFSSNPWIRDLNEEASLNLNAKGCKLFNLALKTLEVKRLDLELSEEGVKETFRDGKVVEYISTNETCNCSSFKTFQAACVHVLFVREVAKLTDPSVHIFTLDIFHERYHRKNSLIDVLNNMDEAEESDRVEDPPIFDEMTPVEPAPLNDKEKFRKIMPILTTIGSLITLHPTKRFYEYLSEFEKIENYVRKGETIFEDYDGAASIDSQEPSDTNDTENEEDVTTEAANEPIDDDGQMEIDPGAERTDDLDDTLPQSSRFSNLKMKDKVKTRGRPKRKTKQLTFNKTAADRKLKKTVQRANKTKKSTKNFIDDNSESEALESEEEENEDNEDENSGDEEDEDSFDDGEDEVMFNNNAV